MGERLRLAVLCLVLGLLTTVALAWGCAAWVRPDHAAPGSFAHAKVADDRWEMITTLRRFGHTRIDRVVGNVPVEIDGDGLPHVRWPVDVAVFDEDQSRSISQCGWPWRALWCWDTSDITVYPPAESAPTGFEFGNPRLVGGMSLSPWTADPWPAWRALPLRPMWLGLSANTMLFALLWALVILLTMAARRARRLKRGLCPRCAYDLRGQRELHCPECGWNSAPHCHAVLVGSSRASTTW
jgi:hypothetical protein